MFVVLLMGCASTKGNQLEDGIYAINIAMEGGSGRASVESPTTLKVQDGKMEITITYSSPYYDYMIVDGVRYSPVNTEGNSSFEIPIDSFEDLNVVADTTAMSKPHEIEYTFVFDRDSIQKKDLSISYEELKFDQEMELAYANQFEVSYAKDGYKQIIIADAEKYLVVPFAMPIPQNIPEDMTILRQPLSQVYLVSTSAMDLIDAIGGIDHIKMSGTKADDWYIENAKEAMLQGQIEYAGKYNAPDYEQILANGCNLAIENTMIFHNPEVKEQLEQVGIPVLVERSSYESHPLGRLEWIKLYGALFNKEAEADAFFQAKLSSVEDIFKMPNTGNTVAFFYVTSNGAVNVRKSSDYISKSIQMAGGEYIFKDQDDDSALTTMKMQMESFYKEAKDADYIIYNSSIEGEIYTIDELVAINPLLGDFKAVQNHHAYCTGADMFQKSTAITDLICDIHLILSKDDTSDEELNYLYQLK